MKRRSFSKLLAAAGISASVGRGWSKSVLSPSSSVPELPEVVVNNRSVEICLNSRYSFHSGYSAKSTNQIIANTLWATAIAPCIPTVCCSVGTFNLE